ncbi:MAG: DNA mismatch repair protein MutS [Chloroflexi bacterium]|nr:DNA mismatch repair protein MutS [Chloroflexota bacterium]
MSADDLTPMRQQYLEIKARYPDKIVLFRLGDFFEAFDEDAEIVARELEITLTARPISKGQRVPMAGVPCRAVESYIARLVERGYHVVIADQVEPPGKKLVRREVTRVITPGTVIDPNMLDQRQNNYLLALAPLKNQADEKWARCGLAYADITTGEFAATELGAEGSEAALAVLEELARLKPREVILPKSWVERGITLPNGAYATPLPDHRFELGAAQSALRAHFGVRTLDGFGLADKPLAVRAAGALLAYLRETHGGNLAQLTTLRTYSTAGYMVLDATTRRNLELTETIRGGKVQGSLLEVLDQTVTPMGSRLLRQWIGQPLLDLARLNARLDAVAALHADGVRRAEVFAALKPIADLERLTNRVLSGVASPRDLIALRNSLESVPALRQALSDLPPLHSIRERLDPCREVSELIAAAIADNPPAVLRDKVGVIREGYSAELDRLHQSVRGAREWLDQLEARERARTGIKSLKVGYNKVMGYYIEVSSGQVGKVPSDYFEKATLANAKRYVTAELKEYETLLLNADEQILALEERLFRDVCARISAHGDSLLRTARAVAHADVFAALAETAACENYTRPTLSDDERLIIREGRHPVVERTLQGERFTPNDTYFDAEERIHILTGPNMSGKSTAIRQVALIVLMAQIGSFVPAAEAHIGLVDRIFTRIGAQDEIHAAQSTFMVEMVETALILSCATPRSLLILDEIGRGTSTYDGLAIARAVLEYIHNHPRLNCRTLFATHYHELTELEKILPRVRNYNVSVLEDGERIVFLHKVVRGGADRSYGIHVAQLAGLPKAVVARAREILKELEANGANFSFKDTSGASKRADCSSAGAQMPLFAPPEHPVVTALKALRVEEMSPLEALTKLYELQRMAREM